MTEKRGFILPAGTEALMTYLVRDLPPLLVGKQYRVTIEPFRSKRSLDQNAYLHAVPLKIISQHTGFEIEELKEYLLGEAFGWRESTAFGKHRQLPVKHGTSSLRKDEFSWFIEWVIAWASNTLNLRIPLPEEN